MEFSPSEAIQHAILIFEKSVHYIGIEKQWVEKASGHMIRIKNTGVSLQLGRTVDGNGYLWAVLYENESLSGGNYETVRVFDIHEINDAIRLTLMCAAEARIALAFEKL